MTVRKLTPAQKAAIKRNAEAKKADIMGDAQGEGINVPNDISLSDKPELNQVSPVFDKTKAFLKQRGMQGATLIQNNHVYDLTGKVLRSLK